MATAKIDSVIRQLRRAVLRQVAAGKTDGQLLASFLEQKDEAAFEALVHRHGPMVFGVCRRIIGNHHDAEDAFQATFLVLARKASSVKPRERVANWLHGVALRTAMKVKGTIAKRRKREKQVTEMPEPEAVQQDQWGDLQPLLDQELNGLPENYRLPILLCDLEGKTIKQAAQQLGWPQGTLASRLPRGRKLLAKRLANRGVVLSAGSLAMIVSQNVVSAGVPTSLMSSTVKAATMIAAGQAAVAGMVPAQVAVLTEGVMKAMLLTKLKTLVAVPLVIILALGGGAGLIYQSQASEQPKAQQVNEKAEQQTYPDAMKAQKPKPDKEQLAQDDPQTIRGTWRVISVRQGNKEETDEEATTWEGSRWLIHAESIDIRMKDGGGLGLAYKLDPSRKPKILDLKLLGRTIPGVYALEGDILQIRIGLHETTRPKALTTEDAGNTLLLILQRELVQKPKPDKEQLQGTWKVVSRVDNGEEDLADVGDEWTFKDTIIRVKHQPKKKNGAFTCYLGFRLDQMGNPKRIEFVNAKWGDWADSAAFNKRFEDAALRMNKIYVDAIYALAGDTLTICLRQNGLVRPTAFESKKGSNHTLIVLLKESPQVEPKKTELEQENGAESSKRDHSVGYIPIKIGPKKYKALFIKLLALLAEHFEQITYANQYEGRMEAYEIKPSTSRTAVRQHALVRFQTCDTGYLITVRISKVRMAGTEEVVGRNTELEREMLKKLNARPIQQDSLSLEAPPGPPKRN